MFLQIREKMKARRGQIRRINKVKQQFKVIIMDVSHQLYGCVNMRIALMKQTFFPACLGVSSWFLHAKSVKGCGSKPSLLFYSFRDNPPGWHPNPRKQMPSLCSSTELFLLSLEGMNPLVSPVWIIDLTLLYKMVNPSFIHDHKPV